MSTNRPDIHFDLHLVLLRDGMVLLGKRLNTTSGADRYHVPAGNLEADETVVEGVVREAREETGLSLSHDDVELAYVMHFRGESDRLGLFFVAKRWTGEIRNLEPLKCAGWEWFGTDKTSFPTPDRLSWTFCPIVVWVCSAGCLDLRARTAISLKPNVCHTSLGSTPCVLRQAQDEGFSLCQ